MDRGNIIRMAREAGWDLEWGGTTIEQVQNFAALVAAAEREACIEILSRTEFTSLEHMPSEAALIIRARGGE